VAHLDPGSRPLQVGERIFYFNRVSPGQAAVSLGGTGGELIKSGTSDL
jgi:hypothetical protein